MHVEISDFKTEYVTRIWKIGYSEETPEWSKWNGPYFEEYVMYGTEEAFKESEDWKFHLKDWCKCILVDGEPVGMVSRSWKDIKTRWLEIGSVIYSENHLNKGIGYEALKLWIEYNFKEFPELEHIGMTTWSGNVRAMKCCEKLGFIREAQIRKVRYWQGIYYDSITYGILRDEWNEYLKNITD